MSRKDKKREMTFQRYFPNSDRTSLVLRSHVKKSANRRGSHRKLARPWTIVINCGIQWIVREKYHPQLNVREKTIRKRNKS